MERVHTKVLLQVYAQHVRKIAPLVLMVPILPPVLVVFLLLLSLVQVALAILLILNFQVDSVYQRLSVAMESTTLAMTNVLSAHYKIVVNAVISREHVKYVR